MTTSDIYLVYPKTDDPAVAESSWLHFYWQTYTYPSCKHERAEALDVPCCLQVKSLAEIHVTSLGNDRILNFCAPVGGTILRSELRDFLLPRLPKYFTLGKVIVNGVESPHHSVLSASQWVTLRGGPKSYFFPCGMCGQWLYTPMGVQYLLEQDFPTESVAMTCWASRLLLPKDLAEAIASKKWKDVAIAKLPTKRRPTDGFPEKLTPVARDLERRPAYMQEQT